MDIGNRQVFVDCGDAVVGRGLELFQRSIVFVAFADCLLEDRRVRSEAHQSVAFDQRKQFALFDQAALEIVQPGRLTACVELFQRIHAVCLLDLAICCVAAARTVSGVKPNFVMRSLIGADAPKVCMPIMAPPMPA